MSISFATELSQTYVIYIYAIYLTKKAVLLHMTPLKDITMEENVSKFIELTVVGMLKTLYFIT